MASVVFVKDANATVYAYENLSYWDKQSQRRQSTSKNVSPMSIKLLRNCPEIACTLLLSENAIIYIDFQRRK